MAAACGAAAEWSGSASAIYRASSTAHEWQGRAASAPFLAQAELEQGKPSRLRARIEFPVAGIGSDNERRDANMREAMKSAEHPVVAGLFDGELPAGFLAGGEAELPLDVTILGRTRRLACKASGWRRAGAEASFDVEFPLSLGAVGIEVPSFLLLFRVHDLVVVRAHVVLRGR